MGTPRMEARTRSHRGKAAGVRGTARRCAGAALLAPVGRRRGAIPRRLRRRHPRRSRPRRPTSATSPPGRSAATRSGSGHDLVPTPPEDGYITHMETDIVDDGTGEPVPISRLMLHHIVFTNLNQPGQHLRGQGLRRVRRPQGLRQHLRPAALLRGGRGAGEDVDAARATATRPRRSDSWGVVAMVMNHRSTADHALIHYEVTVDTAIRCTPVKPYWLDVRDCRADPIYNVPSVAQKASKAKQGEAGKKATLGRQASARRHEEGQEAEEEDRGRTDHRRDRGLHLPAERAADRGRRARARRRDQGDPDRAQLRQPAGGRVRSRPGACADHPFYNVRPILHEPGPINMSAFSSTTGLPDPRRRDAPAQLDLRRLPAARPGDGDHGRLPGARPRGHAELRPDPQLGRS